MKVGWPLKGGAINRNTILPIVKKRLKTEIDELKKELNVTLKYQSDQLDKITKQAEAKAKREYESKLEELKKQELKAVSDGDTERYQEIQNEKENIKPPEEPQSDPVFDEWKKQNDWYESDEDATVLAMGYASKLKQSKPDLPYKDFLDDVTAYVKKTLPNKFTNPNREKPGVTDSGHSETSSKKRGWKDLPDNAKAACKRSEQTFKEKGLEFDRDQWMKIYFEQES
jgi:hypothetical protein